jgi:hypothetical protein
VIHEDGVCYIFHTVSPGTHHFIINYEKDNVESIGAMSIKKTTVKDTGIDIQTNISGKGTKNTPAFEIVWGILSLLAVFLFLHKIKGSVKFGLIYPDKTDRITFSKMKR